MARKRIGLDIGTSSMKAVILEESLRGLQVTQCREMGFRLGPNPLERREAFADAVWRLIPGHELQSAEVTAAIPSHQVSWHSLVLPFGRARQIAKVVKYEIAQHVPYELEDVVSDFFILASERRGEALVRVACVPRERLVMYRTLLEEAGVVHLEITTEALAMYYSYLAQEPAEESVALIDIGASKTTLCLVRDGSFLGASCLYQGGDLVTRRLGEEIGISFEEAEEVKLHPEADHQVVLERAYDDFLSSLGDSVEHTLLAQTSFGEESEGIDKIVLGGGCARMPEVSHYIARRLAVPVGLANPFENLALSFFVPSHVAGPLYHVAAGLALRESYRGNAKVDFQRASSRDQKPRSKLKGKLLPLAVALVALLVLAVGNLSYKLHSKERRYQLLTEQVNALFTSTFPDVPLTASVKNQMMSQVRRVEAELKGLEGLHAPRRMLGLLRELTILVPEEVDLLITGVTLANQSMKVQGDTVSFDAVDTLRAHLAESEHFGDAVINAAKANKRTGRITFTLSASY